MRASTSTICVSNKISIYYLLYFNLFIFYLVHLVPVIDFRLPGFGVARVEFFLAAGFVHFFLLLVLFYNTSNHTGINSPKVVPSGVLMFNLSRTSQKKGLPLSVLIPLSF